MSRRNVAAMAGRGRCGHAWAMHSLMLLDRVQLGGHPRCLDESIVAAPTRRWRPWLRSWQTPDLVQAMAQLAMLTDRLVQPWPMPWRRAERQRKRSGTKRGAGQRLPGSLCEALVRHRPSCNGASRPCSPPLVPATACGPVGYRSGVFTM